MSTVAEITERMRNALAESDGLDKSLKLDFRGEGYIHVAGRQVTNEDAPADCTVMVSREDLELMVKGQLDPMKAMMRGRLKITGDMKVVFRLQSLLRPGS